MPLFEVRAVKVCKDISSEGLAPGRSSSGFGNLGFRVLGFRIWRF